MSERSEALAQQFIETSEAFAAEMAALSPTQWLAFCPGEERTVAALAHHVAWAYSGHAGLFAAMAAGEPPPVQITNEGLDRINAIDAQKYAACDQVETVALLRENAARAAEVVRGMSDEQLVRRGDFLDGMPTLPVVAWIEHVLIGHPGMHLAAIRQAVAATPVDGC